MTRPQPLATGLTGVVSQGAYALTNFAVVAAVARSSTTEAFGVFSLIYAAFMVGAQVSRNLNGVPLAIEALHLPDPRRNERGAAAAALIEGVAVGTVLLVAARLAPPALEPAVGLLALAAPVVLVQDTLRHVAFARSRAADAAIGDLVWIAAQAAGLVVIELIGTTTTIAAISVWAVAATTSAVVLSVRLRVAPAVAEFGPWRRRSWSFASGFTLEGLLVTAPRQAAQWVVGALVGFGVVGAVRAATLCLAPLQAVISGLASALVPACRSVRARQGMVGLRRTTRRLGWTLALAAGAVTAALLLLPTEVGEALVGESWPRARPILWLIGIEHAAAGVALGANIGLRSLSVPWAGVRPRALAAFMTLGLGPIGAAVDGARGLAVVLAGASIVAAFGWNRRWRTEAMSHDGLVSPEHELTKADRTRQPTARSAAGARFDG